ncbi:hypothetical protein PC128_g2884 [Phytophthora cactorum]|nr:hypothetical protein PC128_g2884 [Phytophthora cactorum]
MRNAVYVKNRVYNKGTKGIPYEMMFGVKPDVHHIRNFEALAYVHIPVSPGRKKHHENAKIGFVLGYAEDVVGCMVYFPEEHTAKFVPDLKVAEYVVYRDCHAAALKEDDLSLLHFTHQADEGKNTESDNSDIDMVIVSPEKHHPLDSRKASMRTISEGHKEPGKNEYRDGEHDNVVDSDQDDETKSDANDKVDSNVGGSDGEQGTHVSFEVAEGEVESVAGTCGSSVDDQQSNNEEKIWGDDEVTVASGFASDENSVCEEDADLQSHTALEEDTGVAHGVSSGLSQDEREKSRVEMVDAGMLMKEDSHWASRVSRTPTSALP